MFLILLFFSAGLAQERRPVAAGTETDQALLAPEGTESFQFVVFGDRTGGKRSGLEILRRAIREVNWLRPQFVMTVGDLINGYNDEETWLRQMRTYKSIMDGLASDWYPVAGNHDVYGFRGAPSDTSNLSRYKENFGPLYYSFDFRWAHFVVLFSDEALALRPAARTQNMSREQIAWLQQDLAETEAEMVFVFLHQPRWQLYYEGCNWPEVHEILAMDGRVRTVFAGHTHKYRHGGWRDGIEYITLGMTGANGAGDPELGELHQYNLVTVLRDSVEIAVVPVGSLRSRDFITEKDGRNLTLLRDQRWGRFDASWRKLDGDIPGFFRGGGANLVPRFVGLNPTDETLEVRLGPNTLDRMLIVPPRVSFYEPIDESALSRAFPSLSVQARYLSSSGKESVITREYQLPLREYRALDLAPAPVNQALYLDGSGSCLRIEDAPELAPGRSFTVEAWIRPAEQARRSAIISKAEQSAFGWFWWNDRAATELWVYDTLLGYRHVGISHSAVSQGWQHVAFVFGREKIVGFLNGKKTVEVEAGSFANTNTLPLFIGADPTASGEPSSFFKGWIDEVRISRGRRYVSDFEPAARQSPDPATLLLLHMDQSVGGWIPDGSGRGLHAKIIGGARLILRNWE